jgi:hypothetical protein
MSREDVQSLNMSITEERKQIFECDSRSGAFELAQACQVGLVLEGVGLIDAEGRWPRDVTTGKRVTTRLRELGRLKWDWRNPDVKDWLEESWAELVDWPLWLLKQWVRESNPDAKR